MRIHTGWARTQLPSFFVTLLLLFCASTASLAQSPTPTTSVDLIKTTFERLCKERQNTFSPLLTSKDLRHLPASRAFTDFLSELLNGNEALKRQGMMEQLLALVVCSKTNLEAVRKDLLNPRAEMMPSHVSNLAGGIEAYRFLFEEEKKSRDKDWEIVSLTAPNGNGTNVTFYFFLKAEKPDRKSGEPATPPTHEYKIYYAFGLAYRS